MKEQEVTINKKIKFAVIGFIVLIVVASIVFVLFSSSFKNNNSNNPGGTGGDYTPANIVDLTNSGTLSNAVSESAFNETKSLIDKAVLYNISISNDAGAGSEYTQLGSFDADKTTFYKKNSSYEATIVGGKINSKDGIPWDYWFELLVNDGRKFRVDADVNPDNVNNLTSILKIN